MATNWARDLLGGLGIPVRPTLPMEFTNDVTFLGMLGKWQRALTTVIEQLAVLEETWRQDIADAIVAYDITVEQRLNTIRTGLTDIRRIIQELDVRLTASIRQEHQFNVEEHLAIRREIDGVFDRLEVLLEVHDNVFRAEIEKMLDEFREEIQRVLSEGFYIENPYSGNAKQTVQRAVHDGYLALTVQDHSLAAWEQQELSWTCDEWASRCFTANQLDFNLERELFGPGGLVESEEYVYDLDTRLSIQHKLQFARNANYPYQYPCKQHDDLEYTAERFESAGLTAKTYETTGYSIGEPA